MPDITDPSIVAFVNDKARIAADSIVSGLRTLDALIEEWETNTAVSDAIYAGASAQDEIVDGAREDGRHVVTCNDVYGAFLAAIAIRDLVHASSDQHYHPLYKLASNSLPRF